MEKQVASEEAKHDDDETGISVSMVTVTGIYKNQRFCIYSFPKTKQQPSRPINGNPTDVTETCGIKSLDSARLVGLASCPCVHTAARTSYE
jgi:hypothetical protein